jgi:glyoxylase-like metal-dependent hydrolase (beta-lactamase superfamily II)
MKREHEAAKSPRGADRFRYKPMQWRDHKTVHLYDASEGENFFGFAQVRGLVGLPPEITMLPLSSHTWGHACVVVEGASSMSAAGQETGEPGLRETPARETWVHCGDAYFNRASIEGGDPPAILAHYEKRLAVDKAAVLRNHHRLGELCRVSGVDVFSAHDLREFKAAVAK